MTAADFERYERAPETCPPELKEEFEKLLAWRRRSNAAKRAVKTKRDRYKKWPTRRGDHK